MARGDGCGRPAEQPTASLRACRRCPGSAGRRRVAHLPVAVVAPNDGGHRLAAGSGDGLSAGTGLAWAQHDPDVREAQGAANRVALRDDLPAWVSAHLPDTAAKLRAGGRAGDVGAGHGWASVGLATGFPASQVDAFEPDGPSAQQARANTVGLAVEVHSRPLAADDGPYDLLVLAEMLHDVPHPVDLLATCARTLRAKGTVLVVDMAAAETLTTPAEPMQRLFYGFSLLVCLPDSMSTPGSAATGTVLRPSVLAGYARQAGLTITGVLPVEHDVWRMYVLTQPGVNAV